MLEDRRTFEPTESMEDAERLFIGDFDTWDMTGYYLYSKLLRADVSAHIGTWGAALRTELVNRHCEYTAKGDEPRRAASLQFFEKLGLVTLLNESEQHAILYRATEFLWNVHLAMNNFYNEPPFAERLLELSRQMPIPETVREHFVTTVICCFVGNGYGVCHAAVASYEEMIRSFAPSEIQCAVQLALAKQSRLRQRIDLPSCRVRFKIMLSLFDAASIPKSVKAEYDSLLK